MYLNFILQIRVKNRYYATPTKVDVNYNLLGAFNCYDDPKKDIEVMVVHYCTSKKKAQELAQAWNQQFKDNGNYIRWEDFE